jgi:hypothetical protein
MPTAVTFAQLATRAGYPPEEPLVIAASTSTSARPAHLARGCLPAGSGRVTPTSVVYLASLAKQVTAACAALLVRDGRLDVEARHPEPGTPIRMSAMGVRTHTGHRVYRHGGGYAGVRTMLVRAPERGLGLVIVAPADRSERQAALTDALLDVLIV